MPLIATNLRKRFGGVQAVNGFDIEVERGEIVGLIGPNGAGKTTSFNLLTGRILADEGSVLLDGEEITGLRPWSRSRLGLARTFQHTALFPDLSVADNLDVAFAAAKRPRTTRKERTKVALDLLGLRDDLLTSRAGSLAYGIQRRVSIAISLACEPKYLLLDEPAAGLNPDESADLSASVRAIAGQGVGIILVEHDLELVGRTTDRVMVLAAGASIFAGSFAEALRDERVVDSYLGKKYRDA